MGRELTTGYERPPPHPRVQDSLGGRIFPKLSVHSAAIGKGSRLSSKLGKVKAMRKRKSDPPQLHCCRYKYISSDRQSLTQPLSKENLYLVRCIISFGGAQLAFSDYIFCDLNKLKLFCYAAITLLKGYNIIALYMTVTYRYYRFIYHSHILIL